jgi:hypothetical protein
METDDALKLFRQADLEKAESALNRPSPDSNLRYQLAFILSQTLSAESQGMPKAAAVRKCLGEIEKAAGALIKAIASSDNPSRDHAAFLLHTLGGGPDFDDLSELIEKLVELEMSAARTLKKPFASDGRAPTERNMLVARLRELELSLTGKNSTYTLQNDVYSGSLFLMLRAVENALARAGDRELVSDEALAKFLSRLNAGQN